MRISEAFDMYCRNVIQFENQSNSTESQHELTKNMLLLFLGDIQLEDLTFEMVRTWRNELENRNNQISTIYNRIVRLRCVLDYCQRKGHQCLHPSEVKPPKRIKHRAPGYLTEDEIALLIQIATKTRGRERAARNAAMVSLLYSSGIRVGELIRLNRSDVHYDTFVVFGKGNKSRPCFIDPRARYYIEQYLKIRKDNDAALFVSDSTKKRLSISGVQEIFRRLRKKSGITKTITPHVTRHSFATNFLRNNGNLRYLQEMLGHESIETTQIYTHVENVDLRDAHAKFHSIETPVRKTTAPEHAWTPA